MIHQYTLDPISKTSKTYLIPKFGRERIREIDNISYIYVLYYVQIQSKL